MRSQNRDLVTTIVRSVILEDLRERGESDESRAEADERLRSLLSSNDSKKFRESLRSLKSGLSRADLREVLASILDTPELEGILEER